MPETILFVSRHRVREGRLEGLMEYMAEGVGALEAVKPQTLVFHAYLNEDRAEVSFIHLFADASAMDAHLAGVGDRSEAAYQFIEPIGFQIYGAPSDQALSMMRQAASAGVELEVLPHSVAGFMRLAAG